MFMEGVAATAAHNEGLNFIQLLYFSIF